MGGIINVAKSFHGLFDYIQLFVISNGVNTRYFANNPNSGYKFTFNWTDAANVPFGGAKAGGTMDLESRLTQYINTARTNAIEALAQEEGVSRDALIKYVQEYDYLQREKPEIRGNGVSVMYEGLVIKCYDRKRRHTRNASSV